MGDELITIVKKKDPRKVVALRINKPLYNQFKTFLTAKEHDIPVNTWITYNIKSYVSEMLKKYPQLKQED